MAKCPIFKLGGHGVAVQLRTQHDPPGVYWTTEASYVLVSDPQGGWNCGGRRVSLLSINSYGEIRWGVQPGTGREENVVRHFGLKPWTGASGNPARRKAPNLVGLRKYLLALKRKVEPYGLTGWDVVLDRTREAIYRYGAAALLKGPIRETHILARRYEGYMMPVVTAIGPANQAIHRIERALGMRSRALPRRRLVRSNSRIKPIPAATMKKKILAAKRRAYSTGQTQLVAVHPSGWAEVGTLRRDMVVGPRDVIVRPSSYRRRR